MNNIAIIVIVVSVAALAWLFPGCGEDDYTPVIASYGNISGTITESGSGLPMSNVTVSTIPSTVAAKSNQSGEYYLGAVQPGNYTLIASRDGYQSVSASVTVTERNTSTKNFSIQESPSSERIMPLGVGLSWNYTNGSCSITSSFVDSGITFYSSACWTFGYSHGYLTGRLSDGSLYKVIPRFPVVGDAWKQVDDDPEFVRVTGKDTITVPAGTYICFVVRRDGSALPASYWAMNVGLVKGNGEVLMSTNVP